MKSVLTALTPSCTTLMFLPFFMLLCPPALVRSDCWLIEGDKGYVWLAICSQNQPPYETIPQHINNTVHDLRLNENKIKAIFFTSLSRFSNLTDLNLTKNDISYIEDGAFASQANLQVLQLGYNKLNNLTEGMLRGLGRMQCLFLQHNLIEVIATNAFWECPSLSNLDLSSNKLARLDPSTFTVLGRLVGCELAGNPFHCGLWALQLPRLVRGLQQCHTHLWSTSVRDPKGAVWLSVVESCGWAWTECSLYPFLCVPGWGADSRDDISTTWSWFFRLWVLTCLSTLDHTISPQRPPHLTMHLVPASNCSMCLSPLRPFWSWFQSHTARCTSWYSIIRALCQMWWTWRIKRKWSPLISSNQTTTTPSAWHLYATHSATTTLVYTFLPELQIQMTWCLHPPRPPTTSWPLLAASLECWLFSGLSTTACEDDAIRKRKRNPFVWRRPFWKCVTDQRWQRQLQMTPRPSRNFMSKATISITMANYPCPLHPALPCLAMVLPTLVPHVCPPSLK